MFKKSNQTLNNYIMISVLLIIALIITVLYNILQPNKKYEHLKDLTLRKGYYPIIGHTVMLMEKGNKLILFFTKLTGIFS